MKKSVGSLKRSKSEWEVVLVMVDMNVTHIRIRARFKILNGVMISSK